MKIITLASILLMAACGCATTKNNQSPSLKETQEMMASVVQIEARIASTLVDENGVEIAELPVQGWTGSGVVYDYTGGVFSQKRSMILTANHVVEMAAGDVVEAPLGLGFVRVDAVVYTIKTFDDRVCSLEVVKRGVSDQRDVATGIADCDAGPVAPIATSIPPMGARLVVVGHPLGIPNTMVTEGIFSGWMDGYMVASAPIAGGNSGGPVFYNGEIVGLAVRGVKYPNITIIAPLEQIMERIK